MSWAAGGEGHASGARGEHASSQQHDGGGVHPWAVCRAVARSTGRRSEGGRVVGDAVVAESAPSATKGGDSLLGPDSQLRVKRPSSGAPSYCGGLSHSATVSSIYSSVGVGTRVARVLLPLLSTGCDAEFSADPCDSGPGADQAQRSHLRLAAAISVAVLQHYSCRGASGESIVPPAAD